MAKRRRKTASERFAALLEREPDAPLKYSMSELARRLSVSRQRIFQILPSFTADFRDARRDRRRKQVEEKLTRFLAKHPHAATTPARGGMTYGAIAELLGVRVPEVRDAWRRLGLTVRASLKITPREKYQRAYERQRKRHDERTRRWFAEHPERAREIRRAANLRHRSKVLGEKRCVACGREFDWTVAHEQRNRLRGCRVVCSPGCGRTAARGERERAARNRSAAPRDATRRRSAG